MRFFPFFLSLPFAPTARREPKLPGTTCDAAPPKPRDCVCESEAPLTEMAGCVAANCVQSCEEAGRGSSAIVGGTRGGARDGKYAWDDPGNGEDEGKAEPKSAGKGCELEVGTASSCLRALRPGRFEGLVCDCE